MAGQKIILLKSDCCPITPLVAIGTQERDVLFRRQDGSAVTNVTIQGNPTQYFDLPGQKTGNDFKIHYRGSPASPARTWTYTPICGGPSCPDKAPPQMSNGSG